MRYSNRGPFRDQVNFLRRQFLQDGELPFTNVLTEEIIARALAAVTGWLDRIFSPLVTLWVFLGQVLGADHSCRAAVARLITHRLAQGQRPRSAETGAYCQARQGVAPRTISFTGAMQTLEAFQPLLEFGAAQDAAGRLRLYHNLLDAIATHRVGDRPDRYEPRLIKRRRDYHDWPTEPRVKIKRKMAKRLTKN